MVAACPADDAMAVAAISPLAEPMQIADDVLALQQACEAAIAARSEHDDESHVHMFRMQVYIVAGKSWCSAVIAILGRLAGKVPLAMMSSTVINVDRRYQRALGEVPVTPASVAPRPTLQAPE